MVITAVTWLSLTQDMTSFYRKIPVVLQQAVEHASPIHLHDCFLKAFPDSHASQGRTVKLQVAGLSFFTFSFTMLPC